MWESVTPLGFDGEKFCCGGGSHAPCMIQWNIMGTNLWVTPVCCDQLSQLPQGFVSLPLGNCMVQ